MHSYGCCCTEATVHRNDPGISPYQYHRPDVNFEPLGKHVHEVYAAAAMHYDSCVRAESDPLWSMVCTCTSGVRHRPVALQLVGWLLLTWVGLLLIILAMAGGHQIRHRQIPQLRSTHG